MTLCIKQRGRPVPAPEGGPVSRARAKPERRYPSCRYAALRDPRARTALPCLAALSGLLDNWSWTT